MDFRQLQYFEAVVRAGSVSQAAKQLNMTQPPLSAAISRLEQETGVQLLVRSSHGIRPTAAGRYLLTQGNQLISSRDRVERVLNLMGKGLVGELRVGAEPMVIHELIAQVLSEFTTGVPDVRIALSDVSPMAVLEGVSAGQFDIGCVPFSDEVIADPIAERFEWIALSRIELKLAVPAARAREHHPEGRGWGRWVAPQRIPGLPGMLDAIERALADDPRFDMILVSNPMTAIPLVAAGLGVAPSTTRIWSQHPGVTVLNPPSWLKPMQVTLVLRKGGEVTPLMARWIELAQSLAAARTGRH